MALPYKYCAVDMGGLLLDVKSNISSCGVGSMCLPDIPDNRPQILNNRMGKIVVLASLNVV